MNKAAKWIIWLVVIALIVWGLWAWLGGGSSEEPIINEPMEEVQESEEPPYPVLYENGEEIEDAVETEEDADEE